MRNKLKVSSPSEDFSTKSLDRKLDMLRQQRRNGAESPRRRKASELAAKEIAGEAKGSPRLVRITRLDSTRRSLDIPPAGSSDSDVASNDERPQSMATSYTVNIVGGVAQRMPSTKVSDLHTPNTSILRTSKKTFRRVGANRRISCKDLGHGDCQGWLWKKREASSGMLSGKWTKRWFILKKHNLYYYKQQEDMKAQGIVYLPGFQISPAPEIKSKKFAFKAHHPGTTFYFAAERQDDMGKWMNKMGLAAIVFDVGNLNTTAGFMKPEQAMAASIPLESYYSESDDENDSPSKSDSASSTPQHCASPLPEGASEDGHQVDPDLVDVYRNIKRAELSLDGANKKRRRTSMLSRPSKLDMRNSSEVMISKKLSSLERTLKDRQKELFAIEALLAREDTLTSEELKNFKEGNPEVIEHIYSDQASSSTTQSDEDHTETESLQSGD